MKFKEIKTQIIKLSLTIKESKNTLKENIVLIKRTNVYPRKERMRKAKKKKKKKKKLSFKEKER